MSDFQIMDKIVCVDCGKVEWRPSSSGKRTATLYGKCKECNADEAKTYVAASQSKGVPKGNAG